MPLPRPVPPPMTKLLSSIPVAGHRSLWLDHAISGPSADRLVGPTAADVAIVGGGYVGLWSAIELKHREPSLDVVLLEADICGSGASGRNGGFALTWWGKIGLLAAFLGDEEALRLARGSVEAVDDIRQLFADHGLDCDFHQDGWIWAATLDVHRDVWSATLAECSRLGAAPFDVLAPEEVARRTGSAVHLAGVLEPCTARVDPAKLVRGLRTIALRLGVRIYEQTPVTDMTRGRPAELATPRGTVTAQKVVLATNVWAGSIPEFQRTVVAISSDVIATEPIPERLAEIGFTGRECVSDSQMMIHYYRTTADGRMVFGKGGWGIAMGARIGRSFDRSPRRARVVEENFRRIYPSLADVRITHDWSGLIDRSAIGLPIIGHTGGQPHIVHAVGWSANAVGPSRIGGKFMASLVLEQDDAWSRSPLVDLAPRTFPPEPVRFLGAHLVRAGVVAKERAELEGRKPGRLASRLAEQVPTGLVPTE